MATLPYVNPMTVGEMLVAGGWRTTTEVEAMSSDEQLNTLTVAVQLQSSMPITWFQGLRATPANPEAIVALAFIDILLTRNGMPAAGLTDLNTLQHIREAMDFLPKLSATSGLVTIASGALDEVALSQNDGCNFKFNLINNLGSPLRAMTFLMTFPPATPLDKLQIGTGTRTGNTIEFVAAGPLDGPDASGAPGQLTVSIPVDATKDCPPATYSFAIEMTSVSVVGSMGSAVLSSCEPQTIVVEPT